MTASFPGANGSTALACDAEKEARATESSAARVNVLKSPNMSGLLITKTDVLSQLIIIKTFKLLVEVVGHKAVYFLNGITILELVRVRLRPMVRGERAEEPTPLG